MARGSRAPILLALLALAAVAVPGVFAVQLSLLSEDVTRVGGTGQVAVLAPTQNATITSVKFVPANTAPYYIASADVTLTFAEAGTDANGNPKTYTVVVNIYDALGNLIISGVANNVVPATDANGNPIEQTVTVTFPSNVDPRQIDNVEILVIQEIP